MIIISFLSIHVFLNIATATTGIFPTKDVLLCMYTCVYIWVHVNTI